MLSAFVFHGIFVVSHFAAIVTQNCSIVLQSFMAAVAFKFNVIARNEAI
jgi:hypothetical protein